MSKKKKKKEEEIKLKENVEKKVAIKKKRRLEGSFCDIDDTVSTSSYNVGNQGATSANLKIHGNITIGTYKQHFFQ